jgi:hypothetical protein
MYCIAFELTCFFLILNHAIRRCPLGSPPVSLLITVLQHVFVLCVLNLHYDSLEVTSIIKSVGWGYCGVGCSQVYWMFSLAHGILRSSGCSVVLGGFNG